MNLFMVSVGGYLKNSNIELHDIRFVIGESIKDCYTELQSQWWGDKKMFHIDSWGIIKNVDGYDVLISDEVFLGKEKLYFLNLGGYDSNKFTELHENTVVIANNEDEAKIKAKTKIIGWDKPHKDKCFEVEKILQISKISTKYIHLVKTNKNKQFEFTNDYILLS